MNFCNKLVLIYKLCLMYLDINFEDDELQSKYEDYCVRKNNAGETPKYSLDMKMQNDK